MTGLARVVVLRRGTVEGLTRSIGEVTLAWPERYWHRTGLPA